MLSQRKRLYQLKKKRVQGTYWRDNFQKSAILFIIRFYQLEFFLINLQTHTEENTYKFSHHDKAQYQNFNLIIHLRIHTGKERPYKCNYWDKAFSCMMGHKIHQKVHNGENPYKYTHMTGVTYKITFTLSIWGSILERSHIIATIVIRPIMKIINLLNCSMLLLLGEGASI